MFRVITSYGQQTLRPAFNRSRNVWRSFAVFKTAMPKSRRNEVSRGPDRNVNKDFLQKKGKSHSSTLWLDRQLRDPYYLQAKQEGYRSRATYKLQEIDNKLHLFEKGNVVVDVGAAPGGWSQYVVSKVGITVPASVISIDLLEIDAIPGCHFIQGDFMDEKMKNELRDYIDHRPVDIVISDIAPNFSGNRSRDHIRQILMCDSVVEFAQSVAKQDCTLVLKVLQGSDFQDFVRRMKEMFQEVSLVKPKASRKESTEIYCVMKHFKSSFSVCWFSDAEVWMPNSAPNGMRE